MKSRAALVYAILKSKKIDVGLIIQHSIIHEFKKGIQRYSHPHLIIDLCANHGVKWIAKEEVCKPKSVIDDSVVVKIYVEDNEPVPRPVGIGSSSQARPSTTLARLYQME